VPASARSHKGLSPSVYDFAGGERVSYNAYGKQTITGPSGGVRSRSSVGWDRGFTGYVADNETSLLYARNRIYCATLGRFVSRDPLNSRPLFAWGNGTTPHRFSAVRNFGPSAMDGYYDGLGLYSAYFVPDDTDAFGMGNPVPPPQLPGGGDAPPPIPLPPGKNGEKNKWVPKPGTGDRPVKWKPQYPVKTTDGGQPGSSWDKDGHWDHDKGDGSPREHYDQDGNPMTPEEAHPPQPPPVAPPAEDFDWFIPRFLNFPIFPKCFFGEGWLTDPPPPPRQRIA